MLRLALEPVQDDVGLSVAEAARLLGCDETTVRSLVRTGVLEGWRVGAGRKGRVLRAIRVSQASCLEYREANRIRPSDAGEKINAPIRKPRRRSAAHNEAIASLRALGVRV